jgi:lipoprotein-releasing system permease protein
LGTDLRIEAGENPALPAPPPAVASRPPERPARTRHEPPAFSPIFLAISFGGLALSAVVAVLGIISLSSRLGMAPERALGVAGILAVLAAISAGFLGAAAVRKVGTWEIACSSLVFAVAVTLTLGKRLADPFGLYHSALADVAYLARMFGPDPRGGVALCACALGLANFVGGTLGFLLAGSGKLDLRFSYEGFIARSHLRLRKKSPTMIMTIISIGGVAVGVLALTVVLSVMSGFEVDLKQKIIGTNAHAIVSKYGEPLAASFFPEWSDVGQKVRGVRGVTGVTPFILSEVMISSSQQAVGALIKGIEPKTVGDVSNLPANVKEGALEWLDHPEKIPPPANVDKLLKIVPPEEADEPKKAEGAPAPKEERLTEEMIIGSRARNKASEEVFPGVVMGMELAHSLRVVVGDRINIAAFSGEIGPTGPIAKSRPFRVAGIFLSGMYEYDAKYCYIALREAQGFFGMGDSVTGLELKTDDIDNTRQITRAVINTLDGYPYRTRDWGEMNKNLFSALRLEKLVMAIILAFIVLVACFNIVSTLIMMVLEKSKEISILKSMGSTDTSVMKVFVVEGLIIGVVGTVLGLVLGYFACLFVEVVGIHLDAEVYYIDKLPVRLDTLQFAVVAFIAILLSYLATIYPATRASRVTPVDGLRNE